MKGSMLAMAAAYLHTTGDDARALYDAFGWAIDNGEQQARD
jgi:hypothetical protein